MPINIFAGVGVIVVAGLLTWIILRFFFGRRHAATGTVHDGVQNATITVKGGYSPSTITMAAGTPIALTFDRQETGECTSHVVFSDIALDAVLPGNTRTEVRLPALPPGEYPFACGMNMVHGLLIVTTDGSDGTNGTDDTNTPASTNGNDPTSTGTGTGTGTVTGAGTSGTTRITATTATSGAADGGTDVPAPDPQLALEDERRSAQERRREIAYLTRLVIIGAILTVPVFVTSMLHMAAPSLIPGWMVNPWLQALLITPVMFYCGAPIHRVGWPALVHRMPEMNSLVSMGSTAAYVFSLVACIAPAMLPEGSREPYFESVGVIITLVLLGRLLEAKAREGTGKAIQSLIRLRPREARLLDTTDERTALGVWRQASHLHEVGIDEIHENDILVVKAGERIPVDAVVLDGTAHVDESMITGESEAVEAVAGSDVTGATMVLDGTVAIRVTRTGGDTVLAQIVGMVAHAQATKAPVQRMADRIAGVFVPVVMIIAVWTFAIWIGFGPEPRLTHALVTAVSVLIIACPCALGLATPLSVTAGMGLGATNGVLVTSASTLERARAIRTVVFDKTGTITRGVVDVDSTIDRPTYGSDTIKPTSAATIAALHRAGIRTVMLSGDKAPIATEVARQVGIDTVIARVRPDGKAYWIERLQKERDQKGDHDGLIAMVGDGINDAPALAQADLGIAMGTGTDVAMQSADVTLMNGDLTGVLRTINLSKVTMRNIQENLGWAFGYNVIGIPLAAGVLYPLTGMLLSPMIAGLAMAFSSVCLVLNANRLRHARIREDIRQGDGPASAASGVTAHEPTVIIDSDDLHSSDDHVDPDDHDDDSDRNATGGIATPRSPSAQPPTTAVEDPLPSKEPSTEGHTMHMHHTKHDTADATTTATDPVCGMSVTVNDDAITRQYGGESYYFCSEHCARTFDASPKEYADKA